MELTKTVVLDSLAATAYKKCGCCGRVRDVYFRMTIKDAKTASMIVGSMELCRECGHNMGDIIGERPAEERILQEFSFE